jgi:hypothetical protein
MIPEQSSEPPEWNPCVARVVERAHLLIVPFSLSDDLRKWRLAQRSVPDGLQPVGRGFESHQLHIVVPAASFDAPV